MAQQTKSKATRSASNRTRARKSPAKGETTTKSRSRTRTSSNGSQSRTTARRVTPSRRSRPRSPSRKGTVQTAKDTTVNGAKAAGGAVASTAKRFKTPAIAAGVGLAGIAGGVALGRGTKSKESLAVSLPGGRGTKAKSKKLSRAVSNADVGAIAKQTGQIAERVRQVSYAIGGEQSASRRSPVEVVLEGLTRRSTGAAPRS
jgi:hypothetical protein